MDNSRMSSAEAVSSNVFFKNSFARLMLQSMRKI